MALQIISVLLFTVFFSEALTLVCYNCTTIAPSATCTQTTNCSSNSQCRSMITYSGIGQKSCAAPCANWSIHFEPFKVSSQCCASNLCNNTPAADPENGLMCYSCSDTNCLNPQTLKCKGDENQCFNATVGLNSMNSTVKGCASQNICNNITLVNSLNQGLMVSSVSCCGANLCNNAQSTTQGLFLLVPVLPLLFSI